MCEERDERIFLVNIKEQLIKFRLFDIKYKNNGREIDINELLNVLWR